PQTVTRAVARQIADTLVDQDRESGEIVGWLADDWEVNEDSTQFTFHLREGVTFSDGTALTAESVKNNFDRTIDLGPLAYIRASHLRAYAGTEVIDDLTAVISCDGPNAQSLQAATTQSLSILAASTLALSPEEVARGGPSAVGSGAYTFDQYVPGESITLTRREDYAWGSQAYQNQGAGTYESIEISFIPDATTLAGSVSSGQVDYAFSLDVSTLASIDTERLHLTNVPTR